MIDAIAKKTGKSEEQIKKEVDNGKELQSLAQKAGLTLETVNNLSVGKLEISNVSSRTYGIKMIEREKYVISNFIMQMKSSKNSYADSISVFG